MKKPISISIVAALQLTGVSLAPISAAEANQSSASRGGTHQRVFVAVRPKNPRANSFLAGGEIPIPTAKGPWKTPGPAYAACGKDNVMTVWVPGTTGGKNEQEFDCAE